jgi:aspartate/methionine/tyrosine aminotransferase
MFSSRLRFGSSASTPAGLTPNAITQAVSKLRTAGVPLLDLTETNPTTVALPYPSSIAGALADSGVLTYAPEPLGLPSAREAASRECGRSGAHVDAARVVLTTSTSEAYAILFKLLCDPGDSVLVPQPSYPLFESLAGLEAVRADPYRLEYHGRWSIDRDSLLGALSSRTRAILVVTPNNPTGSMLRGADRDWLAGLAAERDVAIISDEVFRDYTFEPAADAASLSGESRALTFVLGGLSKSAGLPQMKLGWIAVSGPEALAARAMDQLEVICDTYLSVTTSVQLAAPALIEAGRDIRAAIQARIVRNLASLQRALAGESPVSLLTPEAGWSAVLRVPATDSEEALVLRLLEEFHVIVHPGYFFDFATEAFLVVSLLPAPADFDEGIRRVLAGVHSGAAR